MRKTLLAAIIAASALIPAAAIAQDGGDRRGHGEGRGDGRGQQQAPQPGQPARGPDGGRGPESGRGWQQRGPGQGPVQAQPQAQPQPQGQPQARFDRSDRGGRPDGAPGAEGFRRQGGWDRGAQAGVGAGGPPQDRGVRDRRNAFDGQRPGRGFDQRGRNDGDPRVNTWRGDGRPGNDWRGNDRRNGGGAWGNGDPRGNDRRPNTIRGDFRNGNGGWNGSNGGAWSRDWRRDNRYNYNDYRRQNYGAYRLPRYYAPSGWGYGYRRFGIGFRLNSILFAQDYWIDDADDYRLPPAYGPYRWVRYYNDALLVDIRTGNVVDTVYDIFW